MRTVLANTPQQQKALEESVTPVYTKAVLNGSPLREEGGGVPLGRRYWRVPD
jgi:hypothetical protein